jgi:hypothetical protein
MALYLQAPPLGAFYEINAQQQINNTYGQGPMYYTNTFMIQAPALSTGIFKLFVAGWNTTNGEVISCVISNLVLQRLTT